MARRIGIVTAWGECGAGYVSRQFAKALASCHEVFIYARNTNMTPLSGSGWDGPNVKWDPGTDILYPTALDRKTFMEWIHTNRPDVVLFNEQRWWPPVRWCAELGLTTAAYVDYYTRETLPLFAAFDLVIVNTLRHLSAMQWHPGCHYIRWGTDTQLVRPSTFDLTSPPGVTFFHSSGTDPHRKGTDLVLRAFEPLAARSRLIIHSQVRLARVFPGLRLTIRRLLRTGALQLLELTQPLPGFYHLGDVYVYPSRLDGIGLSICEALAAGLPLIVTDFPPMNEFGSPSCRWLVPFRRLSFRPDGYYWPQCEPDIEALRAAMSEAIALGARLSERKRAARLHAEAERDWNRNSTHLPVLFEEARPSSSPLKRKALERIARFVHKPVCRRHAWFARFPGVYRRLRTLRARLIGA